MATDEPLNWFEAVRYCNDYGSNLMPIRNASDAQWVTDQLDDYALDGGHEEIAFIDGTNYLAGNDSWRCGSVKGECPYTAWADGEPSTATGREHCRAVSVYIPNKMIANDCFERHIFFCERNAPAADTGSSVAPTKKPSKEEKARTRQGIAAIRKDAKSAGYKSVADDVSMETIFKNVDELIEYFLSLFGR